MSRDHGGIHHVANDPFIAVPMETYYDETLVRYKKVPYDELHEYIMEGFVEWYGQFKPDADADAACEAATRRSLRTVKSR